MNQPDDDGLPQHLATALIAAGGTAACALVLWQPGLAAVVVVAVTVAGCLLARRHAANRLRVRQLRRVATAYAQGDFAQRSALSGIDGIAWLGSELNALGEKLAATQGALEAQRRMLDQAIGALAEGVACIDYLDRVLYANPAWRHLGAAGANSIGSAYYTHLPAAVLAGAIANVRSLGSSETVEFEHRRRQLRATVSRLDGESLVLVLHDLTELKRLEGARRDFVASVSHELKTPLTAIAGFAETLLDGALEEDPAAARTFVDKIGQHADRLTVLVRDVLTLSRLEQGAWEVRPCAVDVPALARTLCDELQPAASARNVRLVADGPATLAARTDPELLRQLLGNLLSNAIRYNRPGGTATIGYAAVDDRLHLRVIDTGIGIPEDGRQRIFERFYRIDAHRSRATGGTGLGLSIVKQIVDVLQGSIALASDDDGTTFSVDLPLADPRAPRSA